MLFNPWNRLRDWAMIRPDGADDRSARLQSLIRVGFPCAVIIHAASTLLFWRIGVLPLMWINMASVVLWLWACWHAVVRNVLHKPTFCITLFFEVPAYGVISTLFLGVAPGFIFYPLMSVLFAVIAPFLSRPVQAVLSATFIALLAVSGAWTIFNGPIAPQTSGFNQLVFVANVLAFSCMMGLFLGLFDWAAEKPK